MNAYESFLARKTKSVQPDGFEVSEINDALFDFQAHIVRWALRLGRACVFADCGLGKTIMQIEWAHHVTQKNGGMVLILAPLAVAAQTEAEGLGFGYTIKQVSDQSEIEASEDCKIFVTNYDKLDHFDASKFDGVVLDESSILKNHDGKTRNKILETFSRTPYRLACSATPAPNDFMELGNHAEFVGAMTRSEMLSMFFIHDGGETQKWRLKKHAPKDFWSWVGSWACMIRSPEDLGFDGSTFVLPKIEYFIHVVDSSFKRDGVLIDVGKLSLNERRAARKESLSNRVSAAVDVFKSDPKSQWLFWCDLNAESEEISNAIPGSVEVCGSDTDKHKSESMLGFASGKVKVLVTKPKIAGFGMNWQKCHNVVFVGLSDSYEAFYQSVRRCYRFGQKHTVNIHLIISEPERDVLTNVMQKEKDHEKMKTELSGLINNKVYSKIASVGSCNTEISGENWRMINGDCAEVLRGIDDESIDYSIFSPPFASLYTYSNSERDMGNCTDHGQFFEHFSFLCDELFRVTKQGRLLSFHCMLLPTSKTRDGVIGLTDFRGDLIRAFEKAGFIYHSEVCIWKDPVTAMQRTKALGLLHKTIRKDSSMSRQGVPDYVVTMRKPGENKEPIAHDANDFPVSLWQKWASPIWMDINPNETLQYMAARDNCDERHICPLQLEVIRRCIGLWSNPGDTVLSPFAGIGSEGFEALKWGRKFVGIELKKSYFDVAVRNLSEASLAEKQGDLFK